MRIFKAKSNKGFTLIEAVLYLAIAGTVLYFISGFTFNSIFGKSKIESIQDINENNRAVLDEISSTIGDALEINGALSEGGGGSNALDTGLIGYWPFDGNLNDSSGRGKDGTAGGGGPTYTTDRLGVADKALNKANGTYVTFGSTGDFDFAHDGDFTISFWEYAPSDQGSGSQYWMQIDNVVMSGLILGYWRTDIYMSSDGVNWDIASANRTYSGTNPVGVWSHFLMKREGDTYETYRDCSLADTWTSSSVPLAQQGSLQIGQVQGNSSGDFYIDEVKIWERALLESEINSICL
jgi:hypothetical protein